MRPMKDIHIVPSSYKLDVTMVIGTKGSNPKYGNMLTDAQIGKNLKKYCPHIMAITDIKPVTKGDYSKKKVECQASVIHVNSTGRAIDIVSNEITNKLDSVYVVYSARVRQRGCCP